VRSKKSEAAAPAVGPQLRDIPLTQILEPELAARTQMNDVKMAELCDSLKAIGQVEPITVEQHDAMHEIISGHRRFLAARQLKWESIRAVVYPEGTPNILAMRLHENIIREDLNPAEESLYMAEARDKYQLDEEGLLKMFHCSANYLASRFALLRGDPEIFAAVQRGETSMGAAHWLNAITDEGMRRYYLDIQMKSGYPERVVKNWYNEWKLQARPTLPLDTPLPGGRAAEQQDVGDGTGANQASPENGAGASAQNDNGLRCALCGGNKDPYNLVTVFMHKWELESILKQIESAARG
jgi:ParB/RepB/Spo0J family partition protein